jgi:hypothetical protein
MGCASSTDFKKIAVLSLKIGGRVLSASLDWDGMRD